MVTLQVNDQLIHGDLTNVRRPATQTSAPFGARQGSPSA
jgi:hypothetical protein